jgi:hypothetical protein
VLLGLKLGLARCVPVGAVVAVLVKLTAAEVPAYHQLGECSLDCFAANGNALLNLKLLLNLACFEPCVGDAVAELTAFASAYNAKPAFDYA